MKFLPKFVRHIIEKLYNIHIVKHSGLFDEEWYVSMYPDVRYYKKSPVEHFIKYGYRLGCDPSARFSLRLYEEAHPEASSDVTNPLLHYLKKGKKKGYEIFPHCDKAELKQMWLENNKPVVTVIVPNYNHSQYLRKRLDSVYDQTYKNIQVVLLDDVSTDNSVEILREYKERYPEITTLIVNEKNSGSPFAQWRKGIENAIGDFIWIAESDDWCDNTFLEKVLGEFCDESVMLSFARSVFVKENKQVWTIEEYLNDVSGNAFMRSFVMSAHECVNKYFSKKNIIPNVSSCIFRKPASLTLFDNQRWNSMKVCGDWILYLYLIRGGSIAYTCETTNYYRQHDSNTSVGLHSKDRYYEEHQYVGECLALLYKLTYEDLNWLKENLRQFWKKNREDYTDERFNALFDSSVIMNNMAQRLPNVAICGYAFSTGGGEKVPIDQANALFDAGVPVTFIDCGGEPRNEMIRRKLNPCVPVVSIGWNYNLIYGLFDKMGIEIVHTHHTSVDYAISLTKPKGVHHVVTLHGMYETVEHKYLKQQMPHLLSNVSQWLFIADKNLPIMEKYGADTTCFKRIFNAVPKISIKKDKAEVRKELSFSDDAFVVAIASRALEKKGWKDALESVEKARIITGRDICIVFIGNGPLYDEMQNIQVPWAYFTGYSNDVQSYFNAADLVMLPSTYEGESFPLCLLEAFQMSKPVIASEIGEIKRMMTTDEGCAGIVVGIHDNKIEIGELTNALVKIVEDKEMYGKSVSNAKIVSERYSMQVLTDELVKIYTSIVVKKE